jgi:hypothetical protein
MSNTACAPPADARNPEMTSSKSSTMPWRVQRSRSPARNPSPGATTPMLPAIGSTTSAAIERAWP